MTNPGVPVRSVMVWLVLVAAEILHGIARAAPLSPRVGDFHERQIGVLTRALIILAVAAAFVRWIGATSSGELAAVGILWHVMSLVFEVAFGKLVLGYSWERLLSDYNLAEGGLLGIGTAFLALAPLLAPGIRGAGRV